MSENTGDCENRIVFMRKHNAYGNAGMVEKSKALQITIIAHFFRTDFTQLAIGVEP